MEKSAHSYPSHNSIKLSRAHEKQEGISPLLPTIGSDLSQQEIPRQIQREGKEPNSTTKPLLESSQPSQTQAIPAMKAQVEQAPVQLFLMSFCSEPLVDTPVHLASCLSLPSVSTNCDMGPAVNGTILLLFSVYSTTRWRRRSRWRQLPWQASSR